MTLLHAAGVIAHINSATVAASTAAELMKAVIGHFRDEFVSSSYREGCPTAPIAIEDASGSAQLSDVTRRCFQDTIAALAARLTEKDVPPRPRRRAATNALTSIQGAFILACVMHSPSPFDLTIAEVAASTQAAASTSTGTLTGKGNDAMTVTAQDLRANLIGARALEFHARRSVRSRGARARAARAVSPRPA